MLWLPCYSPSALPCVPVLLVEAPRGPGTRETHVGPLERCRLGIAEFTHPLAPAVVVATCGSGSASPTEPSTRIPVTPPSRSLSHQEHSGSGFTRHVRPPSTTVSLLCHLLRHRPSCCRTPARSRATGPLRHPKAVNVLESLEAGVVFCESFWTELQSPLCPRMMARSTGPTRAKFDLSTKKANRAQSIPLVS